MRQCVQGVMQVPEPAGILLEATLHPASAGTVNSLKKTLFGAVNLRFKINPGPRGTGHLISMKTLAGLPE